jgi:hypothetical protein
LIVGLINVAGKIKPKVSAKLEVCLINLRHDEDCFPKGGLPMTWTLPVVISGLHVKKSD